PPGPPPCPAPLRAAPEGSPLAVNQLAGRDLPSAAVSFSLAAFECATDVVVVDTNDLDRIALAARLAASVRGPLLLTEPGHEPAVSTEITRLGAHRVILVGTDATAAVPDYTEVERLPGDVDLLADRVNAFMGVYQTVDLPADAGAGTVAATIEAIDREAGLSPAPRPGAPASTTTTTPGTGSVGSSTTATTAATTTTTTTVPEPRGLPAFPPDDPVPVAIEGNGSSGVAWLIDADSPEIALAAAVTAAISGGLMAVVDGEDLRAIPEVGRALQSAQPFRQITLVGDITENAEWQLPVLLSAPELPGGGYLVYPGRRIVMLYGNPLTAALGPLGEQGPEEAVDRIRRISAPYGADGLTVLPAFEIIVTVASADAGADGNYSNEFGLDVFGDYLEVARREGLYVILDLQPGRTDFLTQAKLYEEILKEPFVGLALDPEWRLKPDQVHLQQIGTVTAEEVNTVVDWLADLVRENNLPQKVLLLHQFRTSMLQNRETIRAPEELSVVIQMDGLGRLETKYNTWNVLTDGWEDHPWRWGWKNFYDEDDPTPTPDIVLDLVPTAVMVSYQ
ncbi:MAG TPA: hypothetical protein VLD62_06205, partial [Acidimicrobiia bacterium]|nr:hypothetical protein [Acidimicrobiia bacterium]